MADDAADTIAQYDLDDDFPDYANEQNKELNQIVSTFTELTITFSHLLMKLLGPREGEAGVPTGSRDRGAPRPSENSG